MDMELVVSLIFGVVGTGFGVYQTMAMRRARNMYRSNCRMRCRDAKDKAERLAENATNLCRVVNQRTLSEALSKELQAQRIYGSLSGQASAIIEITKDWVRFCTRLNEEHQDEFKEPAISQEEVQKLSEIKQCLSALEVSSAQISPMDDR